MNIEDIEKRVFWFTENEKEILKLDFSGLGGDDIIKIADYGLKVALDSNNRGLLFLYDATNAILHSDAIRRLKHITKTYGYVRDKSAVIGVPPIKRIIFNGFMIYSENRMRAFSSYEDAITYLTS